MLQAYNDWAIDEWCGAYPGRFIPLGIVPMWDVDLAVEEVHRLAQEGLPLDQLPRDAARRRASRASSRATGTRCSRRSCDENMVPVAAHRRRRSTSSSGRRGTDRPPRSCSPARSRCITAQDLLFGPTLRKFPDLKVALSEGGIGWIPFYLDRIDRHFENQAWLTATTSAGKLPSEVFREHILACYITDPSGLQLRHRIGIDIIAWECDYPHTDTTWPESPEFAWKEFQDAGCTDDEIHKITWENACRFFDWDPFTRRRPRTPPSVRCAPGRPTSTPPACPRRSGGARNELAGIGVLSSGVLSS